jgi:glycosyltransferase involved in cell wall biosynthesis
MRALLIHQHCPISGKNGGVETFIQDLIAFKPKDFELSIVASDHIHEIYSDSIVCLPLAKKTWIPATLLTFKMLLSHARLFKDPSIIVIVNRFEYVLFSKLLYFRSSVEFFKHTVGRTNESRSSDSYWRYMPRIYRLFQRVALRLSKNVWTFDKNEIVDSPKVSWIPLRATTDLHFFSPAVKKTLDVIWIGRLESPKNPELASRILSASWKFGVTTLIIGEGSHDYVLHDYRAAGGLTKPFLTKSEIARELAVSRILLMTSEFEAAPRVMIEALSSGCFIICTRTSDPNSLINEFPSRITYFDSEDQAISIILDLKQKSVDRIDLTNYANDKQFLRIWKEIIGGNENAL